jgi:hypothetical protein
MNEDIGTLIEQWYEDKAGRTIMMQMFDKHCKDGTLSPDDQQLRLLKMLAEDILVLRWFVEKLLLKTRDENARDTGTPN